MLRILFLSIFSIVVLSSNLAAEGVSAFSSDAPSAFSSRVPLDPNEETSDSLQKNSMIFLKNTGGTGKAQTFSSRGSPSSNTAVNLEGIPLNSVSSGSFDFSELNSFGLEEAEVLRGAYGLQSSKPGAQVLLRLPQTEKIESTVGIGQYSTWEFKQRIPHLAFTYEQSENDFFYRDRTSGLEKTRTHNFSRRINTRAWKRTESAQVWGQFLFSHQDLPGSTLFPSPHANSTAVFPTLAAQFRLPQNFEVSTWAQYRHETFDDPDMPFPNASTNRTFALGARLLNKIHFGEHLSLEQSLQFTEEKLFSEQFQAGVKHDYHSPYRSTLAYAAGVWWSDRRGDLLQPRLRLEFMHPASKAVSAQPGLGVKIPLRSNVDFKTNIQMASRAPNFSEMYFEFPPQSIGNRSLRRQLSYQGDAGYEAKFQMTEKINLELGQAFYIDRTEDLIMGVDIGSNVYQSRNVGTSIAYGLENNLVIKWDSWFALPTSYRLSKTSLNDKSRPYEPTHLLTTEPTLLPKSALSASVPLYWRSEVRTSSLAAPRIGQQWDLGLKFRIKIERALLQIQLQNLLAWRREEVEGYPIAQEPNAKASVTYEF